MMIMDPGSIALTASRSNVISVLGANSLPPPLRSLNVIWAMTRWRRSGATSPDHFVAPDWLNYLGGLVVEYCPENIDEQDSLPRNVPKASKNETLAGVAKHRTCGSDAA